MNIKLINGQDQEIHSFGKDLAMHFADPHNYTKEILEQFNDSIYKDYIQPGDDVILDIGANVGLFALHVTPFAKKIICVEPTPSHMEKQKIILAPLKDKVIHEEAALSDTIGTDKFHWCGINTTMNSLQDRHSGQHFLVRTVTLEWLCSTNNLKKVNFAKIDIEGSEWKAIQVHTVKPVYDIIDKIFIELHPPDQHSQEHFQAIFEEVGYKVERVIHDTLFCYK